MTPPKTILITGAAGGIGQATAKLFAKHGWELALVDLKGEVTAVCDVANFQQVQETANAMLRRFGKIDVLVNNAGVSQPKSVVELDEAAWDRTIEVNLKSAFNWAKALLPAMLDRRSGKMINVSSMSAKRGGGPGTVSKACYAASKAGLLGFTRGLAREVAPHVQVNAVCPGLIATPMTNGLLSGATEELLSLIPLGRFGTPEDVAQTIFFLASPGADYLTGEIIDINGGMYID